MRTGTALWSSPNRYRRTIRPERESRCWLPRSTGWLWRPGSCRSRASQCRRESCCTRSRRKWTFRTVPQAGRRWWLGAFCQTSLVAPGRGLSSQIVDCLQTASETPSNPYCPNGELRAAPDAGLDYTDLMRPSKRLRLEFLTLVRLCRAVGYRHPPAICTCWQPMTSLCYSELQRPHRWHVMHEGGVMDGASGISDNNHIQ